MKKEMQKILAMSLFMVLVVSMVSGFAAAKSFDEYVDDFTRTVEPVLGNILGESIDGGALLVRVMAFLLVMFVIYGVLGMVNIFGNKPWINLAIGAIVGILGVRFLPGDILQQAVVPSSAFVGILVLGIPFILLAVMIPKIPSKAGRRAVWIGFGVLILILWIYNWDSYGDNALLKWFYPLIAIGCAIMFILDGTFHRMWGKMGTEKNVEAATNVARDRVAADIDRLQVALSAAPTKTERARIAKEIAGKRDAIDKL